MKPEAHDIRSCTARRPARCCYIGLRSIDTTGQRPPEPVEPRCASGRIQRRHWQSPRDLPRVAHVRGVSSGRSCAQGCLASQGHVEERGGVRHLVSTTRRTGEARSQLDEPLVRSASVAFLGWPAVGWNRIPIARREQRPVLGCLAAVRQNDGLAIGHCAASVMVGTPAPIRSAAADAERGALGIACIRFARRRGWSSLVAHREHHVAT